MKRTELEKTYGIARILYNPAYILEYDVVLHDPKREMMVQRKPIGRDRHVACFDVGQYGNVGEWGSCPVGFKRGKRVAFDDLPLPAQNAIKAQLSAWRTIA